MPEQPEGSPVGTADMHGGGVTFKDRDGNDVSFEVVRLGTTKEFETAKGALATSRAAEQSLDGINSELKTKIGAQAERIEAAETAYKTIKVETQALLTNADKNCMELREKLEAASNAYSTEKEVSAELTKANQGLAEGIQRQKDTIASMTKELTAAREANDLVNEHWREEKVISAQLREELAEEKRMRIDSDEERGTLLGSLESAREVVARATGIREGLASELVTARAELVAANDVCADRHHDLEMASGERDDAMAESSRRYDCHGGPGMSEPACGACVSCLTHIIEAKDSELCDLMTVKASLEETNTALEVSQKELCESKEDAAALKVEIHGLDDQICEATGSVLGDRNEMLAEVVTERNTSRQALANIKAELLTEGDRFKTILDTLAEKITGE